LASNNNRKTLPIGIGFWTRLAQVVAVLAMRAWDICVFNGPKNVPYWILSKDCLRPDVIGGNLKAIDEIPREQVILDHFVSAIGIYEDPDRHVQRYVMVAVAGEESRNRTANA
jgi:hypothetical protein